MSILTIKTHSSILFYLNEKHWVGKTNHNTREEFVVFKPGGGKYETKLIYMPRMLRRDVGILQQTSIKLSML